MDIYAWILTLAIVAGQLVKIPIGNGGANLLDITVIALCFIGLFQVKLRLVKPPLFIQAGLGFGLIAALSLVLTPLQLSAQQYISSSLYIVRFLSFILLGWLLISRALIHIKQNIHNILLLSGVSLAILGLLQFMFLPDLSFLASEGWDPHYYRTVSTFLDPNFAGAYLVLTLLLLLSLQKQFTPLLFTLIYIALLTTFSRSSYLMFLVSGLTFSFLKKSKTFTIATILLFVLLLGGFQIYTNLVAEPRHIDRTQSASSRLNTWQQGLQIFQKNPVLGVGFNAYRYALREYNLADEQFLASHGSSSNDSSLLFVTSTTGIIGLLAYLYFLFSLGKQAFLEKKKFIILPAIPGLLIHSFFANSLFYPSILAWIVLISIIPKK